MTRHPFPVLCLKLFTSLVNVGNVFIADDGTESLWELFPWQRIPGSKLLNIQRGLVHGDKPQCFGVCNDL